MSAISWLSSASKNFARIKSRSKGGNAGSCSQIEHYTDVVAEATAAEALAPEGSAIAKRASNLAREATHAQRLAVQTCRRPGGTPGMSGAKRRRRRR